MIRKLISLLLKNKLTLAVAESCTGGLISHKLTTVPGVSEVFREGIICYSNTSKTKRLGIKQSIIKKYGAVSYEVCSLMAKNITKSEKTDVGISITGIAGPLGNSQKKPVAPKSHHALRTHIGLVYIGINVKGRLTVYKYNFKGDRESIQQKSARTALELLKSHLSFPA